MSIIVADLAVNFVQLVLLRRHHDKADHLWQRCGTHFLVLALLGMHNQPSH
jgi:hypothetical protein